jgi:hypothetical protein
MVDGERFEARVGRRLHCLISSHIALATERMKKFRADPERHTPRYEDHEDTPDG